MNSFTPEARSSGLLESQLEDELVLYDVENDRAHGLNPVAAELWRACDGQADVPALTELLTTTEELVWLGLAELSRLGLLEVPVPVRGADRRMARRELLKKIAAGGAVGLAVPTVLSVAAGDPAAAATCRTQGQSCTGSGGILGCYNTSTCCAGLSCCGVLGLRTCG